MKTIVLCILLVATINAFTIPNPPAQGINSAAQTQGIQETPDHKVNKRFISAMLMSLMDDDDDYFDDWRRRRPSRRTIQLAQMIRQLAGPGGLSRAQIQNMQQNLQNMQLLQNMQQILPAQNLAATSR